jgi:hypothetical protein
MKALGIKLYWGNIDIDFIDSTLFIPIPIIRRYEEMRVVSSMDTEGYITHKSSLHYRLRCAQDPIAVGMARKSAEKALVLDNEEQLKESGLSTRTSIRHILSNQT